MKNNRKKSKNSLKQLLMYDINLTIYKVLGLVIIVYSFYSAYYLTKPLWIEPDLRFIYKWTIDNFPNFGFFLCLIPIMIVLPFTYIGNFALLKNLKGDMYLRSLASIIGFFLSFLFLLTLIPFSISVSLLYLGLVVIEVGLVNLRNMLTEPSLMPDKRLLKESRNKDPYFALKIERSHNRWMEVQKQSIWMIVTAIFGTLINAVLVFQSRLYGYFGGEMGWLALVFARYQLVIFGVIFIYFVLGLLIFLTYFCYKKQILLEKIL